MKVDSAGPLVLSGCQLSGSSCSFVTSAGQSGVLLGAGRVVAVWKAANRAKRPL